MELLMRDSDRKRRFKGRQASACLRSVAELKCILQDRVLS